MWKSVAFLSPTFIYLCQRFVKTVSHNVFKLLYIFLLLFYSKQQAKKKLTNPDISEAGAANFINKETNQAP